MIWGAVLADACAIIEFHFAPSLGLSRLTGRGTAAMRSAEVLVFPVTVWEITRKAGGSKLGTAPLGADGTFSGFLRERGYGTAELSWRIAEAANALPPHHKDPMDRMLIATALQLDLAVVTNDATFPLYGVRTVW